MKQGYFQIYTGDGKGKTTAALGLCLRAAGAGLRVYIAQFMKKGGYSELASLKRFEDCIVIAQFGTGRFVRDAPEDADITMAEQGLDAAAEALASGEYNLVVLDEACVAAAKGLITVDALLKLAEDRRPGVEIVMTGRGADPRLTDSADLVTEMKMVKHYFNKGVPARAGIEK